VIEEEEEETTYSRRRSWSATEEADVKPLEGVPFVDIEVQMIHDDSCHR